VRNRFAPVYEHIPTVSLDTFCALLPLYPPGSSKNLPGHNDKSYVHQIYCDDCDLDMGFTSVHIIRENSIDAEIYLINIILVKFG
jgi:hypothetical protein